MIDQGGARTRFNLVWTGALLILLICALALAWFPVLRITSLPSINYNEGWNAYRDRMAASGQPLYGSPPHLWITNYPFLSFHMIGFLGRLTGNMVIAGRAVALAALVAICVMLSGIVRTATGSRRGGAYAGLCFFLWIATYTPDRMAMDDPDLLGAAITLFGLYSYIRASKHPRASPRWLIISAISFAAGIFTKQDVIALPLSAGLHLLTTRNWRGFAIWSAAGIIAAGLLLLATFHWDGAYFFAHLLRARAYAMRDSVQSTSGFFLRFAAPLALCAFALTSRHTVPLRGLFLILLPLATIIAIIFAGGDGVALNIFYVPLIATAAASAIAVCWIEPILSRTHWPRAAMALVLALPALPGIIFVPGQIHADIKAQRNLPALTKSDRHTIMLLRRLPGPAICQDILLCFDAGKPLGFDPFFVKDQIATKRLNDADITAMLKAHRYAAVEVSSALARTSAPPIKRRRFSQAFMQTLRAEYRPALIGHVNAIYTPRRHSGRGG